MVSWISLYIVFSCSFTMEIVANTCTVHVHGMCTVLHDEHSMFLYHMVLFVV